MVDVVCSVCGEKLSPHMMLQYQHYKEHNDALWVKIWDIVYSSPKKFDPKGHKDEG